MNTCERIVDTRSNSHPDAISPVLGKRKRKVYESDQSYLGTFVSHVFKKARSLLPPLYRENKKGDFTTIPHELALEIFSFFEVKHLCNVRLVCKSWSQYSDKLPIWRKQVEDCNPNFFQKLDPHLPQHTHEWIRVLKAVAIERKQQRYRNRMALIKEDHSLISATFVTSIGLSAIPYFIGTIKFGITMHEAQRSVTIARQLAMFPSANTFQPFT